MHVSKGWDCFAVFHSKKYHRQILLMFIPMFSDVVFLKNIRKKKTFFTLLPLSLSVGIVVIWSQFLQGGLSLVSRDVKRQIHSPSNTSGPTHPPVIKSNFPTIFFPANYFGMTWMHIKIHKKFIIYSFSCRFSGIFANMLIIDFCYQLILINLYQQYRSKISEPLNAFPTQSQRVCVCVSTQTQTRLVKLISRSHFKTILHNKRPKQSRLFCHIRLSISTASVYSR